MTLHQGSTEFMLAMGLEDKMVGTASMDDTIWPRYAEAPTTTAISTHMVPCGTGTYYGCTYYGCTYSGCTYSGCTTDGVPLTEYLQAYGKVPILSKSYPPAG